MHWAIRHICRLRQKRRGEQLSFQIKQQIFSHPIRSLTSTNLLLSRIHHGSSQQNMLVFGGKCMSENQAGIVQAANMEQQLQTLDATSTLQQSMVSTGYWLKDGMLAGKVGSVNIRKMFLTL